MSADPILTLDDVAKQLHYFDRSGALKWLRRHDVKVHRRDKRLLVKQSVLDAALEKHAEGGRAERVKGTK